MPSHARAAVVLGKEGRTPVQSPRTTDPFAFSSVLWDYQRLPGTWDRCLEAGIAVILSGQSTMSGVPAWCCNSRPCLSWGGQVVQVSSNVTVTKRA